MVMAWLMAEVLKGCRTDSAIDYWQFPTSIMPSSTNYSSEASIAGFRKFEFVAWIALALSGWHAETCAELLIELS